MNCISMKYINFGTYKLFLTQTLCHYLKSKALQETTFRGFELVNESSQIWIILMTNNYGYLYAMHTVVITAAQPVTVNSFAFRWMKESVCWGENYADEKNTPFVYWYTIFPKLSVTRSCEMVGKVSPVFSRLVYLRQSLFYISMNIMKDSILWRNISGFFKS